MKSTFVLKRKSYSGFGRFFGMGNFFRANTGLNKAGADLLRKNRANWAETAMKSDPNLTKEAAMSQAKKKITEADKIYDDYRLRGGQRAWEAVKGVGALGAGAAGIAGAGALALGTVGAAGAAGTVNNALSGDMGGKSNSSSY